MGRVAGSSRDINATADFRIRTDAEYYQLLDRGRIWQDTTTLLHAVDQASLLNKKSNIPLLQDAEKRCHGNPESSE